jgi:autotransporter-associated beta strand protein
LYWKSERVRFNAHADLPGSTGFFGDEKLSVGSFIGGGIFYLGSNQVTFTNGNGTVSGVISVISDCAAGGTACANSGASGGALVKSGSGAMTLANTNTYTGGTTINGGQLVLGNATAAGRIIGSVTERLHGLASGTRYWYKANNMVASKLLILNADAARWSNPPLGTIFIKKYKYCFA